MNPVLAAVGSATVAVLSQSSGIERPSFAMRRGHVVYNNCVITSRGRSAKRGRVIVHVRMFVTSRGRSTAR